MLLAIDVGNTSTMMGLFDGEGLAGDWRIGTYADGTSDEYGLRIVGLLRESGWDRREVTAVVMASVVPRATSRLEESCARYLGCSPLIVRPEALGVRTEYVPPDAVGPDRLANAVGAGALYGWPAIVVDFGTTTTVDAIDAEGTYLGGAIAPGVEVSVQALYACAARLSWVEMEAPERAIGRSTAESLRSGVIYGFAGQVDGLVRRFLAELGAEAHVIATGGQARRIVPWTETVAHVDEHLTLHGLRVIWEREARRAS